VDTVNYGILGRISRKDGKYAGLLCSGQERDRKKWSMHIYYDVERVGSFTELQGLEENTGTETEAVAGRQMW
jgi:hypothetical protein